MLRITGQCVHEQIARFVDTPILGGVFCRDEPKPRLADDSHLRFVCKVCFLQFFDAQPVATHPFDEDIASEFCKLEAAELSLERVAHVINPIEVCEVDTWCVCTCFELEEGP